MQFSPDGVLLATADRSGGLFVWEADTAREYLSLRGHNGAVCDVSWRLDSNVLASAGEDTTVKLWEMNDGNAIKSWGAHGGGVFCVALHARRADRLGRPRQHRQVVERRRRGDQDVSRLPRGGPAVLLHARRQARRRRRLARQHQGLGCRPRPRTCLSLAANPPTLAMQVEASKADLAAKQAAATAAANELAAAVKVAADKDAALKAATDKHTAAVPRAPRPKPIAWPA